MQCNRIIYNTMQYNRITYNTSTCIAWKSRWWNTKQCKKYTMQNYTIQCNTIPCSTIELHTIQVPALAGRASGWIQREAMFAENWGDVSINPSILTGCWHFSKRSRNRKLWRFIIPGKSASSLFPTLFSTFFHFLSQSLKVCNLQNCKTKVN